MDYKSLSSLAVKIPEPRNYFHGTLAPELLLPGNILLFHRRTGGFGATGSGPGSHKIEEIEKISAIPFWARGIYNLWVESIA